ncbi:MAG TPA: metallophosphoesterase [Gemmatales bacterium]|nr:metallophosphoesterase [Gemmatales bacterium]HMP60866.1 metallophosphoesterase [Gemmatales bacterium]
MTQSSATGQTKPAGPAPGHQAAGSGSWVGLLAIGDPHLASRVPGFRKDDYPRVIVDKLRWALEYARGQRLLPIVLGDWFHWPRDNANWLVVDLLRLLADQPSPLLGIVGNHDCHGQHELQPDDTLAILEASGVVRLLGPARPWTGLVGGRRLLIGSTPWAEPLPTEQPFVLSATPPDFVVWLTHHDLRFPGLEGEGRYDLVPLPGVDLVINGHLHAPLPPVTCGQTTWMNPGNLTRIKRSDATRLREPLVTRIDFTMDGWQATAIPVPHQPFDAVFHEKIEASDPAEAGPSLFIQGLDELQARRTDAGAGFVDFLELNLREFPVAVRTVIRELSEEVLRDQTR